MPVYEYDCTACGTFDQVRTIAERDMPACCPACGLAALRTLSTAPRLATMNPRLRRAHTTNERSAHAPKNLQQYHDERAGTERHGAGCACCRSSSKAATTSVDDTKSFPGKRPWMISH